MTAEPSKNAGRDTVTLTKEALRTNFALLLTELTALQEEADNLTAKIATLSDRVNDLAEHVENM